MGARRFGLGAEEAVGAPNPERSQSSLAKNRVKTHLKSRVPPFPVGPRFETLADEANELRQQAEDLKALFRLLMRASDGDNPLIH
jgi:hypothetical protein